MNRLLEETLKEAEIPVKYYEYKGTEPEYIVYNEEAEQPVNYGDNKPLNTIVWWQVHLFAPKISNFRRRKKMIKRLLLDSGFIITDIATLFEKETETIHVVISCHMGESEEEYEQDWYPER